MDEKINELPTEGMIEQGQPEKDYSLQLNIINYLPDVPGVEIDENISEEERTKQLEEIENKMNELENPYTEGMKTFLEEKIRHFALLNMYESEVKEYDALEDNLVNQMSQDTQKHLYAEELDRLITRLAGDSDFGKMHEEWKKLGTLHGKLVQLGMGWEKSKQG